MFLWDADRVWTKEETRLRRFAFLGLEFEQRRGDLLWRKEV
jgi:hypothetical protein